MYFQKIVEAGMKQDSEALNNVLKVSAIDEFKIGSFCFSAVSQLAMQRDFKAMEFLISHGANFSFAVEGAITCGQKEIIEALLTRGASIAWAVQDCVMSRHILKEPRQQIAFLSINLKPYPLSPKRLKQGKSLSLLMNLRKKER